MHSANHQRTAPLGTCVVQSSTAPLPSHPSRSPRSLRYQRRTCRDMVVLLPGLCLPGSTVSRCSVGSTFESQFVGPQPCRQWWRPRADYAAAGNTGPTPPSTVSERLPQQKSASCGAYYRVQGMLSAAWPNPSFKRSANGMAHWPSSAGPAAHCALAVQHAMPLSPA